MIEITHQSVVDGLSAIVAECGEDFVYPSRGGECVYVYNGKPDCIVGRFLASVGVPVERLAKADTVDLDGSIAAGDLLERLQQEGIASADRFARNILQVVQVKQDGGHTWGEALDMALTLDRSAPVIEDGKWEI